MAYRVRKMRWEDIEPVKEIDHMCFPSMMPPTSYKTELINPMAHYIVAYDDSFLLGSDSLKSYIPLVLGFAGLWLMAGEAHIINLAVRPEYQHQGIGELLLNCLIETSMELKADLITLEVRVSNLSAQRLYNKYGFTHRGLRHAYYIDNREDAVIMTLDNMNPPEFQANWRVLKQQYQQKWGVLPGKVEY
jgi:ribosomal-protein-alanine N-acetyltransferase